MQSNALKAISETPDELRVANYLVLFGGRDLEGIASDYVNDDGSATTSRPTRTLKAPIPKLGR